MDTCLNHRITSSNRSKKDLKQRISATARAIIIIFKRPSILLPFLAAVFLNGCEQNHTDSNINLRIAPLTLVDSRSFPTSCSDDFSRADISIDDNLFNNLKRQENGDSWHGSFQVPSGKHSIGIRFVCVLDRLDGREEITLATASKEYDSSSENSISFTSDDYFFPDNDADKTPNITELIDGTDPGPEPGNPNSIPIQITHENWQGIYKSTMETVRYIATTSIEASKSSCVNGGSMQQTPGGTLNGYSQINYVFQDCFISSIKLDGDLAVKQPEPANNSQVDMQLASQRLEISNTQEIITAMDMSIKVDENTNSWHQDVDLDLVTPQGKLRIENEPPMTGRILGSYPNEGAITILGAKESHLTVSENSNQDARFSVNNGTSVIADTILWSELGWELIRPNK